MLKRLYATNYRCLVNFEFKPDAVQLIIGRNGMGKTTVLDVLALLRDFATRNLPCEDRFMGKTVTRWQTMDQQRFELDVAGNGGVYRYVLVVDEIGDPARPRVKEETLDFEGRPLFRFHEGELGLFNDKQSAEPNVIFRFDWHRSGLAMVEIGRKDNTKLTWFRRWLDRIVEVQINPWAIFARSERESSNLAKDAGNFADWYRHLRLGSGNAVFEATQDLKDAIPGLEALDMHEAGLDVRVLQASIRGSGKKNVVMPFSELSEGQRALIVLYVMLHCAVGEGALLMIDEPDNFIALAEIQPWLLKLIDFVEDRKGQVILVSHHPELLDQLASEGAILLDRPNQGETRVLNFPPAESAGLKPSDIIARGWERA